MQANAITARRTEPVDVGTSINAMEALLTLMSPASAFNSGNVLAANSLTNKPAVGGQMQARSELPEGMSVFVATPAFGGSVTVEYMTAVVDLITKLTNVGWQLQLAAGQSILTVGRNNAVMEFLESQCTHLLFLDADVSFDPETIEGLLRQDVDVALAPYPDKNIDERKMQEFQSRGSADGKPRLRNGFSYRLHADEGRLQEAFEKGQRYVEVEAGPAGCMLIKRSVFDVMKNAYPTLKSRHSGTNAGVSVKQEEWWQFFDTMVTEDNEFVSEDIAFCRRWRATGGKVIADIGATMTHVGRHQFTGSPLDRFG